MSFEVAIGKIIQQSCLNGFDYYLFHLLLIYFVTEFGQKNSILTTIHFVQAAFLVHNSEGF
jgi:hypothetical protein